ncbi:MAG: VOC family protein [Candidatus Caldarchaeum sp.]|nr:VOC family protein [Candidatus Caldarchaeum sp.]
MSLSVVNTWRFNQKIVPHLWFDKQAKEAAEFYVSVFDEDSEIEWSRTLRDTPSGDAELLSFRLRSYRFMAINGGPFFKFNPSISFMVNFSPSRDKDAHSDLALVWEKLSHEGKTITPLAKTFFSQLYGCVQDKYGLTWSLILPNTNPSHEERPFIIPVLSFEGEISGRAKEAINYYLSVFKNSREGMALRYENGLLFSDFMLEGQWFAANDGSRQSLNRFNESVSFMIYCRTQDEIDYYWDKLSAVPEAEQCGWLKDRFGVSWQVVPLLMDRMMVEGTEEQLAKLSWAFLEMKKIEISVLEKVYGSKQLEGGMK